MACTSAELRRIILHQKQTTEGKLETETAVHRNRNNCSQTAAHNCRIKHTV